MTIQDKIILNKTIEGKPIDDDARQDETRRDTEISGKRRQYKTMHISTKHDTTR